MNNKSSYFWTIPFSCFIGAYLITYVLFSSSSLATPSIVGLSVQDALTRVSDATLNIRLIGQMEDNDLPAGTIISQTPAPNQRIKPRQSVFVVVSTRPEPRRAPSIEQQKEAIFVPQLQNAAISCKSYTIPHHYPASTCIGQIPRPNEVMLNNKLIAYVSEGAKKSIIMPQLKELPTDDVIAFLEEHDLSYELSKSARAEHKETSQTKVADQKPLAGTIIDRSKQYTIQVYCT